MVKVYRNRVKALRCNAGLTQDELGKKCGLSQNTISDIENYKTTPSIKHALDIADTLGESVNELFWFDYHLI